MNAYAGSLLTEYLVRGSVDLSAMPESKFSRTPLDEPPLAPASQEHLDKIQKFKRETWEFRGLAPPMPISTLARVPIADELIYMIRTHQDLENNVVGHPLHLTSVYDEPGIVDFIFHGQIMGYRPRIEVVSRLKLPAMLVQLKAGLPAAQLGSDHLAIGARFQFKE
ncbi:hypothetical protein EC968_003597 [Mortierella alpina]|nr:hypothetical protein EC968_003597 [Mortierella alpina]